MGRDREFAIKTTGLGNLNRSLGKISKDMRRDSLGHIRRIARRVRGSGRTFTPVGKTHKLQGSLRYTASNRGAAITSAHPGAGVHEYGGVIAPRGTPITIKRSRMVGRAIAQETPRIEEELGDLLDSIARNAGFH